MSASTTGAITASGATNGVTLGLSSQGNVPDNFVNIQISGTSSADTFRVRGSRDGGTTWFNLAAVARDTAAVKAGGTDITVGSTYSQAYYADTRGLTAVNIYANALTTVSVAVAIDSSAQFGAAPVLNTSPAVAATGGSFASTGSITSSAPTGGGIGYATGAGGAVTQITSRTTGVTLSKLAGAITLFSAAGSATPFTFTVTNTTVAATDTIVVVQKSGTDVYSADVSAVGSGSFAITITDLTGTTTETPVFNFAVLKSVSA